MHTLLRVAVIVLCGVLVLSACAGNEASETARVPTASASDRSGPEESQLSNGGGRASDGGAGDAGGPAEAPAFPPPDPVDYPGMYENTREGAEQALRFFIAQMHHSFETNSTSGLAETAAAGCEGCNSVKKLIERNKSWGSTWSPVHCEEAKLSHLEPLAYTFEIEMEYALSPHTEPMGPEGTVERLERTEYVATAALKWGSDRWVVHALELEWGPNAHGS